MKRVPRGAFFLSSSDVLFDFGTCVLMPGNLAIDWEKERKRERWIVIHRKSIGIPRGLPSNSYEAITDGKLAVSAGKKAELTLNSTAL